MIPIGTSDANKRRFSDRVKRLTAEWGKDALFDTLDAQQRSLLWYAVDANDLFAVKIIIRKTTTDGLARHLSLNRDSARKNARTLADDRDDLEHIRELFAAARFRVRDRGSAPLPSRAGLVRDPPPDGPRGERPPRRCPSSRRILRSSPRGPRRSTPTSSRPSKRTTTKTGSPEAPSARPASSAEARLGAQAAGPGFPPPREGPSESRLLS